MLVRAARRRVRRDVFRHFNVQSEPLYLPWLCPAQMRLGSHTQATSVGSGSRRIELNRETLAGGRRHLATAAVAEQNPLLGGYVPFENLPPAYAAEGSHAGWLNPRELSSLRPFDPSSAIVINRSMAVERRHGVRGGFGADLAEIHLTLDACLRVERLERAATLVRRLAEIYDAESKELLDSHNQYIRASVGHAVKTHNSETFKSIQKWFEVEMRSKGARPDATTYALLIKGALLFLRGPKIERTIRRYMELAADAGGEVQLEVLSLPILSDSDIYRITEMCPTEFPKDDEYVPEIPEPVSQQGDDNAADLSKPVPEVKPAQQRGLGLIALKKSLSIFGDSQLPSAHEVEGTEEDRNKAYALARQRRLEEDAVNAAIERWREEDENLRKMGLNTSFKTRALGALMWSWYTAMVPLIKTELRKVEEAEAAFVKTKLEKLGEAEAALKKSKPKKVEEAEPECLKGQADYERCLYGPFLRIAPPEKLAAVTILGCMSTLSAQDADRGVKMMNLLRHVGHLAEEESMAEIIKDESNNDIWGGIRTSERRKKLDSLMKKKHTVFRSLARLVSNKQKDLQDGGSQGLQQWNTAIKIRVGGLLVSLLVGAAKMPIVREHPETGEKVIQSQSAFFHTYQYQQGKKVGVLMANPSLAEKLRSEPVADALAKHLPMVVTPKKWTSFSDGGFLVNSSKVMRVKGSYGEQQEYALVATKNGDLDQVFAGLDVLSKTPWKINRAVFDIMLEVWNSGEAVANIPPTDPKLEYPPEPDTKNPEERRRWIRAVREAENVKSGLHSQRCFLNFQLEIARAFLKEKFYFPHNLDFRGRAYPIPPYLNHMGADNCRGLLMFADGKELGATGLTWLKVHVANVFGYDKASFKEREAFCTEHLADVYDSAVNPLNGKRWWLKAEDPWQCLAACIELKKALDSPQPARFKSHLAIHQDGTCNGLQHYAALGGDMWGARQVNLEPGERPADIYTAVANLVAEEVSADAAEGNEFAKHLEGKITRKVVKQTVMTNVYGVTFAGARAQVQKQLEDAVSPTPELSYSALSAYVARKIFKSLSSSFNGAHNIQDWLGECAKRISQSLTPDQVEMIKSECNGELLPPKGKKRPGSRKRTPGLNGIEFKSSVVWTTPLKIPVVQPYRKSKSRVVTTSLQRVSITEPRDSDPVSKRKQSQAFPPNFIHSLDATHMLLSAIRCNEAGLTFAAVHDSFWTHACDVDTMNHILRDAFIQIHTEDVIARLAAEFRVRYKRYMYLARVPPQSALGQKIKGFWDLEKKKTKIGAGKHWHRVNGLLLEHERLQLLESDDPMKREKGRKMVTPGSIVSEMANDHEVFEPITADSSGQLETEIDQPLNMEAGIEAEVDTEAEHDEEEEEEGGKVAKSPKKRPLQVWLPLTFPPVPQRGEFDVSRLRESKYFFS